MEVHHVEVDEQAHQVTRVLQEHALNVIVLLQRYLPADHLVDILEHSVDSVSLLLFLRLVRDVVKRDTLELEEDTM